MRRRTNAAKLVVLYCVLLAHAAAHAPAAAIARVGERIEFDSAARGTTERIWGFRSLPQSATGKIPLMLILHSSGGIHERDWHFARTLNDIGIATFVIDSFGPRGLDKVYENKLSFNQRKQLVDALSALRLLERDPRIDRRRIGAMGRSLGGETSLRLVLRASRERIQIRAPSIAVAVAINPGCMAQEREGALTPGAEAHLFLAEKDFSPYQQCVSYAERIRKAGGRSAYKIYPDTFHVFDGSEKPVWSATQEVYARCPVERFGRGRLIRLDTGQEMKTAQERDLFFRACVTRGAWVGGSPVATVELDRDWTAAVRARLTP